MTLAVATAGANTAKVNDWPPLVEKKEDEIIPADEVGEPRSDSKQADGP